MMGWTVKGRVISLVKKAIGIRVIRALLLPIVWVIGNTAFYIVMASIHSIAGHGFQVIFHWDIFLWGVMVALVINTLDIIVEIFEHARKVSALKNDIDSGFQQLSSIINVFINHPRISETISLKLVKSIESLINTAVDRVDERGIQGQCYIVNHNLAVDALTQMLEGLNNQIASASKYGLSVESVSPNPDGGGEDTKQYPLFVMNAVNQAKIFLGVSLMPPSWWCQRDIVQDNHNYGLWSILEVQEKRLKRAGQSRLYARIFVIREDFLHNYDKFSFQTPVTERQQYIEDGKKQHPELTELYTQLESKFVAADNKDKINEFYEELMKHDPHIKELQEIHERSGMLMGVNLVNAMEYKNSMDFVFIVDDYGYESIITSWGFNKIITKNDIKSLSDLNRRYNDLQGFVEGRLYYGSSIKAKIFTDAQMWWTHEVKKLNVFLEKKKEFLKYFDEDRPLWVEKCHDVTANKQHQPKNVS